MDSVWKSTIKKFLNDNKDLVLVKDWKGLINKAKKEGLSGSILYLIGKIFGEDPYKNAYYAISSYGRTLALRANKGNDVYGTSFVLNSYLLNRPQLTFKTLQDAIKFCDILIEKGVRKPSDLTIKVFSDKSISDYDYELVETEYGPACVSTLGIADNNRKKLNKLYKHDEDKLIAELEKFNYNFSDDLIKMFSKNNIEISNQPSNVVLGRIDIDYDKQTHKLKRVLNISIEFNSNAMIDESKLIYPYNSNHFGFDDKTNRKIEQIAKSCGYDFNSSEEPYIYYNPWYVSFVLKFERDM